MDSLVQYSTFPFSALNCLDLLYIAFFTQKYKISIKGKYLSCYYYAYLGLLRRQGWKKSYLNHIRCFWHLFNYFLRSCVYYVHFLLVIATIYFVTMLYIPITETHVSTLWKRIDLFLPNECISTHEPGINKSIRNTYIENRKEECGIAAQCRLFASNQGAV